MFKKISVIGLGLLGGSICKSIKKSFHGTEIYGYGRNAAKLKPALNDNSVDFIDLIENISLKGIELIVVASPINSSIKLINKMLRDPELDENTLIIDMGSVKGAVLKGVEDNDKTGQFIGCHPMAGSEKKGYIYSRSDLFENETVIITPGSKNKDADIKKIIQFWKMLKSEVTVISSELHDEIVAYTSHLPHLAACFIVQQLMEYIKGKNFNKKIDFFIGNGFLDQTRVSSGSAEIWNEIFLMNKENIVKSITGLIDDLGQLKSIIKENKFESDRLQKYFYNIKQYRDSLI